MKRIRQQKRKSTAFKQRFSFLDNFQDGGARGGGYDDPSALYSTVNKARQLKNQLSSQADSVTTGDDELRIVTHTV